MFHYKTGAPLSLLDGGASPGPYLVTSESLGEVVMSNEGRGMWRTYLEHQVGPGAGEGVGGRAQGARSTQELLPCTPPPCT